LPGERRRGGEASLGRTIRVLDARRQKYSRRLSAIGVPCTTFRAISFVSSLRMKPTTRPASSSDWMLFGEVFEVETARSRARESSRSGAA
jgi:hypothetical protein